MKISEALARPCGRLAFYHDNCADGTTSAAVMLLNDINTICVPVNYGSGLLEKIKNNIEKYNSREIFFVDFGPDIESCNYLNTLKNIKIVIIDHHKTFAEKIKQTELIKENFDINACFRYSDKNFTFVYDPNECGSTLTYKTLFYNDNQPVLLKYIKDRDLWLNKYQPETEYISNIMFSKYIDDPKSVIEMLRFYSEKDFDTVINNGKIITDYKNSIINKTIRQWNKKYFFMINDIKIPAINSNIFQSEIGNIISQEFGICCIYTIDIFNNKVLLSFRSINNTSRATAELLGGGGHDNAAGASINIKEFNKIKKIIIKE